ncbi:hypothetical protein [Tautonia marina]|uniref:hypothetical protein n=1 Tax=Tautonia marina TaxID=2653855 RepID=UPI00191BCBB3|nr:hypothetical protein [Tautonia marina]
MSEPDQQLILAGPPVPGLASPEKQFDGHWRVYYQTWDIEGSLARRPGGDYLVGGTAIGAVGPGPPTR